MEDLMAGRIYLANEDHETQRPNELSFQKGDLVTLASELLEDKQYYQAVLADGSMGLIRSSFILQRDSVPLLPMPWFHSTISRMDAEKLLDRNWDGQFLLRTSQSTKGIYALAMSHEGKIHHYLVAMDFAAKKLTINGVKYYSNLPELVEYHMSETGGVLGTTLKHLVVRRGTLDFHIDQDLLKNEWGLPNAEVELGESLGKGEFGEVVMAVYRGVQAAGKLIHEDKQTAANTASFLREAAIITNLRHKNLVQLIGLVFQGSGMKCILTELMGKGSLQKYLISRGRSVISQAELLSFSRDVCDGMVYISSQGFVHRDLAARNVLLNNNGQAKISDFGLSRKGEIHVPHEGGKFPVKWTAPEALKESKFSVKSDMWSYGVLLWEIYSFGRTPYPSVPTSEVLESIEDGNIMDPPDICPDEIYDLMCMCWEIEPDQRPTFFYLRQELARSFRESRTPQPSPLLLRRHAPVINVDELVNGPIATKAYKEALHHKTTLFLGGVIFLGPQGGGKTSLLRSLMGESFRLVEPPSQSISIMENCFTMVDNLPWHPSTSGLVYEDELVKIVVDELLKYTHGNLSNGSGGNRKSMSTLGASLPTPGSVVGNGGRNGDVIPRYTAEGDGSAVTPPPLPPMRAVRSHSFTSAHSLSVQSSNMAHGGNSLSDSFEAIDSMAEGQNQSEAKTQGHHHTRQFHHSKGKKGIFGKILTRGLRNSYHPNGSTHYSPDLQKKVQRHHSDAARYSTNRSSEVLSVTSTSPCSSPVPQIFSSPLPEHLTNRIKEEFGSCMENSLPPKHLARLVDTSGNPSFRVLQSLFLIDNSICLVVFDASRDILSPAPHTYSQPSRRKEAAETPSQQQQQQQQASTSPHPDSLDNSYLFHVMAEISNVCMQWSGSKSDMTVRGPRIILVGTHSDEVPSSVTHRNFEILRDEVRASPYEKYVAITKFVISNSSIIERSSMDDFKKFVKEMVKKCCRQQVPLKWLRCVRRFQGLLKKNFFCMSLVEARKLISEVCDISPISDPEIDEIIYFFHHNHLIMHFPRVYQLRDLIIVSTRWFAQQVSIVFGAGTMNVAAQQGPLELIPDQEHLKSTGILSNRLLDYVWRDKNVQKCKEDLLAVMNKMDLLCVMASDSHPLSMASSIEDLTREVPKKSSLPRHHYTKPMACVVVPALVEEPQPPSLSSLPAYDVQPILFRFKDHVPNGLFHRLLARCVQSYPQNYRLYQHAATFEFDNSSLLKLVEDQRQISLTLHPIPSTSIPTRKISSLYQTNGKLPTEILEETIKSYSPSADPTLVSPDTCMAVLMFIQATVNDLTQQWTPHLDFDMCVHCNCKAPPIQMDSVVDIDDAKDKISKMGGFRRLSSSYANKHYIILNDVDEMLQQSSLRCQQGSQVPMSPSLLCWFGEVTIGSLSPVSPAGDIEYVTDEDVDRVVKMLGSSWRELGQTLGFSRVELERVSISFPAAAHAGRKMLQEWQSLLNKNATFSALLGALEIIQHRDIADDLVHSRLTVRTLL